ncbi:MAG TPA: beta-N-acetylhexosaminidase [Terriglobales bacterium]|nr:beta-N-acetylhexosaminidase [Terriglobales bacterium]
MSFSIVSGTRTVDIRAQAGQLLVMGFAAAEPTAQLRQMLQRLQPGGVVLFARNLKTPRQTWELLRECRRQLRVPPFLAVDMEGGTVDRFRQLLGPSPAAAEVFASGDRRLFRRHGRVIGTAAKSLGFNVDFAPVLDLAFPASRSALGTRAVSTDPSEVILYAREFLAGLGDAGLLGCGKHFPGLGEGSLDSHRRLPVIEKPWKKLWAEDLVPYRRLRSRLPMIMVCHAAYPAVTREQTPASLSQKWITEVLRRKLGYRGLVLSDDLDMGAVLAAATIELAAVATLRAGADMYLVCQKEENVELAYEAVVHVGERDRSFARRLAAASRRVLASKRRARALQRPSPPPRPALIERLTRELWELGEQVRLETFAAGERA